MSKIRIDLRDLPLWNRYAWHVRRHKRPYISARIKDRTTYLHRVIMDAPKGLDVDHIDGDPLNNSRRNLRLCTRSQNLIAKRRIHNANASGFRGVALYPRTGRFASHIQASGRKIHLGYYKTAEEAARAYDKKALELFGEFAQLNFPISA